MTTCGFTTNNGQGIWFGCAMEPDHMPANQHYMVRILPNPADNEITWDEWRATMAKALAAFPDVWTAAPEPKFTRISYAVAWTLILAGLGTLLGIATLLTIAAVT